MVPAPGGGRQDPVRDLGGRVPEGARVCRYGRERGGDGSERHDGSTEARVLAVGAASDGAARDAVRAGICPVGGVARRTDRDRLPRDDENAGRGQEIVPTTRHPMNRVDEKKEMGGKNISDLDKKSLYRYAYGSIEK